MKQNLRHRLWVLVISGLNFPAWSITVTETLPKGVRGAALVYVESARVDSTFNPTGKVELLSQPLNRTLSFDQLAQYSPQLATLKKMLESFGPFGLSEGVISAELKLDLKIQESRRVGALVWALSDDIMLGVMIPVVSRNTESVFSSNVNRDSSRIRQALGILPKSLAGELDKLDQEPLEPVFLKAIFDDNGYQRPKSFDRVGLGDVEIESRVRYFRSENLNLQFRLGAELPTANHQPDIRNLFDRGLGSGAYGFKAGTYHDVRIVPGVFSFNSAFLGTLYTSNFETRGIKRTSDQFLPNLTDPYQIERVKKQTSPKIRADAGFMVEFWRGAWALSSTYVFEGRGNDRYKGARDLDYGSLSVNSWSRLHGIESSLELSSVPSFVEKKAPLPGKLTLTWFQPIGGKNVALAPYGRLDVLLLF